MTEENKPDYFRIPKPSLRQRRIIAMSSAAAFVVLSLGAFAFLPPVQQIRVADNAPALIGLNTTVMVQFENGAALARGSLVVLLSFFVVVLFPLIERVPRGRGGRRGSGRPPPGRDNPCG